MSEEIILSGQEAVKLLEAKLFPSSNIFGGIFFNRGEEGIDVLGFEDGYILTEKKKYSYKIFLKNDDFELVFSKPNQELRDLIDGTKSEFSKRTQAIDSSLGSMGYPLRLCKASLVQKEFICNVLTRKNTPSKYDRSKIFDIAKAPQLENKIMRWYVPFFSKWLQDIEGQNLPEPEGRMHLAYLYRHTGNYLRALKVTNVTEFGQQRFPCPPRMLGVLCTIRAATFLDIYELHWDPKLLKVARKTNGKAWAMEKGSHVILVYKRLEKFERELERMEYNKKVVAAYKDWAAWM